jgi:hypothetical protein
MLIDLIYVLCSITLHWHHKGGVVKVTTAKVGMNLLQAARYQDIDLEGEQRKCLFIDCKSL